MRPRHLKALEHLPAVIEALEALAGERDRLQVALAKATNPLMYVPATATEAKAEPPTDGQARADAWYREVYGNLPPLPPLLSGTANLQTPERQEFEAARKAGQTVPADMTELQAERVAFLAQKKAERAGLMAQFARDGEPREAGAGEAVTEGAPLNVSGS